MPLCCLLVIGQKLTNETPLKALAELALISHVVLNGGEGGGAAEGEHDGAERQEEVLEAVDAPAEHEGVDFVHHLDEVQDAGHHRGAEGDDAEVTGRCKKYLFHSAIFNIN